MRSSLETGRRKGSGMKGDESRWQAGEGPAVPGRLELQRIGVTRQ